MTCLSTVEYWETTLRLPINDCCLVSDLMLISILSMSVEHLEMSCTEAAVALALLAKSLPSDVCLQEVKFILNSFLSLCHFLLRLARLILVEFFIPSSLGFETDRQVAAAGEPLPQALFLGFGHKVLVGLVVEHLTILDKVPQ